MATNKQRREAARRQLELQLQRRAEQQAARKRVTLIASVIGTVVLIVVVTVFVVVITGGDKKGAGTKSTPAAAGSSTPGASPTSSAGALPLGTCKFVAGGQAAKKVSVPANTAPTKGIMLARVATSQGTLTFALNRAKAPCAVQNFLSLAQQGYYSDTPCHRLVDSSIFVLQCGDPTGSGSGGPGYTFNDELTGSEKYTTGVLAMANGGANTNGSQFFIVYKPSTGLGPNYTIFGKVTGGLDVVTKVAAKGSDNSHGQGDGKPKLPISITSVSIAE
ncbi:MAG: peptidylprolyl isomerase [Actinomycetota bacterium]|nr:peptidylprolyl isomerase [Actinomycetota bacterium]